MLYVNNIILLHMCWRFLELFLQLIWLGLVIGGSSSLRWIPHMWLIFFKENQKKKNHFRFRGNFSRIGQFVLIVLINDAANTHRKDKSQWNTFNWDANNLRTLRNFENSLYFWKIMIYKLKQHFIGWKKLSRNYKYALT